GTLPQRNHPLGGIRSDAAKHHGGPPLCVPCRSSRSEDARRHRSDRLPQGAFGRSDKSRRATMAVLLPAALLAGRGLMKAVQTAANSKAKEVPDGRKLSYSVRAILFRLEQAPSRSVPLLNSRSRPSPGQQRRRPLRPGVSILRFHL